MPGRIRADRESESPAQRRTANVSALITLAGIPAWLDSSQGQCGRLLPGRDPQSIGLSTRAIAGDVLGLSESTYPEIGGTAHSVPFCRMIHLSLLE